METDASVKGTTQEKQKRPRIKRTPPKIDYQIGKDVLDQKANISVRDLITVSPAMRRQLVGECRPSHSTKINPNDQTMALIEDDDMDTTAVYSQVSIENKPIRALIDCGAAKTCMSKKLADELGLKIDASSESVFTLGNGTKQPALGVIYDVPLEVKRNMTIPCTIEVLPICPNQLIIGRLKEKIRCKEIPGRVFVLHRYQLQQSTQIIFPHRMVSLSRQSLLNSGRYGACNTKKPLLS
ncbi:hypothetical protein G6F37_013666 [Rhizopus arrhizus]|nr:hypothetical protein G6F37_013666 [Rhizopus arrhizus]